MLAKKLAGRLIAHQQADLLQNLERGFMYSFNLLTGKKFCK
jgi:hypothetical protein